MKLLYFIFIITLLSCTTTENISDEPVTKEQIKYLALGDSYTIGQSVEDSLRWPNQLTEELKENRIDISQTDIIAKTGWTTSDLIAAMQKSDLESYNLVSLLIGVNNQYQGLAFEVFTTEFDSLLNWSVKIAKTKYRVFVVSIPDYGVTPFGQGNAEKIAEELDNYNNYMQQECKKRGILFINITEISRIMGGSEGALTSDDLHPSGQQYEQWVSKMTPKVLGLLSQE